MGYATPSGLEEGGYQCSAAPAFAKLQNGCARL
jgi:hypothetical protein